MPPIVIALITALVPFLVGEAEKLISRGQSGAGPEKHAWVTAAVADFMSVVDKHVPDWAKPDEAPLAKLIDEAIEAALSKL